MFARKVSSLECNKAPFNIFTTLLLIFTLPVIGHTEDCHSHQHAADLAWHVRQMNAMLVCGGSMEWFSGCCPTPICLRTCAIIPNDTATTFSGFYSNSYSSWRHLLRVLPEGFQRSATGHYEDVQFGSFRRTGCGQRCASWLRTWKFPGRQIHNIHVWLIPTTNALIQYRESMQRDEPAAPDFMPHDRTMN